MTDLHDLPSPVHAALGYLAPSAERPVSYAFEPPPGTPWENCAYDRVRMPIADARRAHEKASIDREGFELHDAPTAVVDFLDDAQVRSVYYREASELALAVTENNKRQIEREKKLAEARDLEEKAAADAVAARLSALEIEIPRRTGENDALYGSVTSADIAQALKDKGFEVDKRKVQLPDPIKALGDVQVPVRVHRDVTAQVKVKVVAEQR